MRGLALAFLLPSGQQWRTAMINLPVFPDNTPQGFYERLLAAKPLPATGQPDPQKMAAFLARHPETAAAMKIIKQSPPSTGFEDSAFHGLNAFHVTNSAGATVPVRWTAVPEQPTRPQVPARTGTRNYLFDSLIDAVAHGPLTWRLILTIGEPSDPTNDATKPWPSSRRWIDTGTIIIDAVQTEAAGKMRAISIPTRWCCPTASRHQTILCSARGPRSTPDRSPAAPENPSGPAQSMPHRCSMSHKTVAPSARFTLLSRLLHWSMTAMVIAQLLIGVTMVASLSYYPLLLAIHRPLGVAILAFAIVRLVNRSPTGRHRSWPR